MIVNSYVETFIVYTFANLEKYTVSIAYNF